MNSTSHSESPGVPQAKPALRRKPGMTHLNGVSPNGERAQGNPVTRFFKRLGPGLITGASDDDPAGIITYAMAGATLGFSVLWTALITMPLMLAMQLISARIGLVRGNGIASVIKQAYGRSWLLYSAAILVLIANTINLGADVGAIAAAIQMETGVPARWLIVPVTLAILAILTFGSYRIISTIFKWLTLPLLAYIAAAFLAQPSISALIKGTFVPQITFSKEYLMMLVAILGTTITPYLWFWQANQEVEEIKNAEQEGEQPRGERDTAIKRSVWDITSGIVLSNLVMYAVIVSTGATLFKSGHHDIKSATDAASALTPAAGSLATLMFAIGIIGAGTLVVPILAGSASYAVGETFGWQVGIDRPWYRAKAFYAVIAAATIIGMLINFTSISAITALFYSAVINGLIAPPLMVIIMLMANNDRVMGTRTNGIGLNVVGWSATALMGVAAVLMIVTI